MYTEAPQSWFDLPVLQPIDPRTVIQSVSFQDNAGTVQFAKFARVNDWLKNVTWANPPLAPSGYGAATTPSIAPTSPYDYDAVQEAGQWNSTMAMTVNSTQLPIAVQKIMFLKAGSRFTNNIYFDWLGGVTSSNVELSFRDNSMTSGDFQNGGVGYVPVFQFPAATFGGTGKMMSISIMKPGRYQMAIRIQDSAGNWSLFEMEWYVVS